MVDPLRALAPGDALLVVDVQPDFCPGGALPVEDGDAVIGVLNAWIRAAHEKHLPIYASRDWHPPGHVSFEEAGGPWPPHCLQDTPGAAYHPGLLLPREVVKIAKGVRLDHDQYSAFDETGLAGHLRDRGVERVFVGGLALDVCVRATLLDGAQSGFEMHLVAEATRPVDPKKVGRVREELLVAGVRIEDGP